MKRLSLSPARIIAIVIFIGAAVSPIYSQATEYHQKSVAVQTSTGQEINELNRTSGDSSEKAEKTTGSRFVLPENGNASSTQTNSLRYMFPQRALGAGGMPTLLVDAPTIQTTTQTPDQGAKQSTTKPFVFPTRRERFNRYVRSVVGPSALLRSGVLAGINQWKDSPEEWEQGVSGYGKRFASSFGRNAVQQTIIYGLDSALGLDTGFRRSGRKGFWPRVTHALAENITSRTKSGKRVISVPRITGAYVSGVISREAWYPERYNYKDGLRAGNNSLLTGFALNLVREFVVRF
jgi:hypothetical protein